MEVFRRPDNPIIEPKDVKPSRDGFEVVGVFNAGVARFENQVVLLLRVAEKPIISHPETVFVPIYDVAKNDIVLKKFPKNDPANDFSDPRLIVRPTEIYLTSLSHLRLARSEDGVNFDIEETPAMGPATDYETFGLEDARISLIDGTYYVTYAAVSPLGITTCLASTEDFTTFERYGVIFCPDNKDVVLFGERINGKYYALSRPNSPLFKRQDIWIAESDDLFCWGRHRYLMGPRAGCWDEKKVGAGAVPIKTEWGWLEIYHGADREDRYCLGAVLLDEKEPSRIIARSQTPVLEPETDYECEGFFGNIVFSCGLLCEGGRLRIYYGAADTSICYAELVLADVLESLKPSENA